MKNNIICAIYFHPEAYPPTLNALAILGKTADIDVLFRPHLNTMWTYPNSIHLHASGKHMDIKAQEESNIFQKGYFFLGFVWRFRSLILNKKPRVIILYDSIPLFAYYLIRWSVIYDPIIWYHNHDVVEQNKSRKYSIGWFAAKFEPKMFPYLNLFSLPSKERIPYFPISNLKGKYLYLPNFPSKEFYSNFIKLPRKQGQPWRLIYQGSIDEGHGLEIIIQILSKSIGGRLMELHLAGRISPKYKTILVKIAEEFNVVQQVIFHGNIPYAHLPSLTITCDIGIAIHEPKEIIYQTGGTASNKIYEYAACGLPILYLNYSHYNQYLSKYSWAIATDLKPDSVKTAVETIVDDYARLSTLAREEFEINLNFEKGFESAVDFLTNERKQ